MGGSTVSIVTMVVMILLLSALAIAVYSCIARYMKRAFRQQNQTILFIPREPTTSAVNFSEIVVSEALTR